MIPGGVNVGRADRVIRLVTGVLLLGFYGALDPPARYLTLVGLLLLGSALSGYCPVYRRLGWSTLRRP